MKSFYKVRTEIQTKNGKKEKKKALLLLKAKNLSNNFEIHA